MGFFSAAHGWRGQKCAHSLKSVTHTLQWWNIAKLYLTKKKSKKYMNHVTHSLSSADISNVLPETNKFCYFNKYMYRLHFHTKFLILLTFLESIKIFLIKKVSILMMSAKMATLGLLKIKEFWKEGYDVIIYVHDITSKILSRDLDYIADVIM